MMRKLSLIVRPFLLVWAAAPGVFAQDAPRDQAPPAERHEFVIANFRTESGVTLPQVRNLVGRVGAWSADALLVAGGLSASLGVRAALGWSARLWRRGFMGRAFR